MFDFADGEHVVGVVSTDPRALPEISEEELAELAPDTPRPPYVIGISRGGKTARFGLSMFKEPSTVNGRMVMRLDKAVKNDLVVGIFLTHGHENVSMATHKGRCLIFQATDSKILSGAGKGVLAIKLQKGDYVVGFTLCTHRMEGLEVETSFGRTEVIRSNKFSVAKRGGKGREVIRRGTIAKVHLKALELDFPKSDEDLELTEPDDGPFDLEEGPEVTVPETQTIAEKIEFAATVPEMPVLDLPEEVVDEKVPTEKPKKKKTDPEDDGPQGDLF
jgi:DNA gyrase subunit A